MMVSKGKLKEKIFIGANAYMPPLPGIPLLELVGNSRVMIENHLGVLAYSDKQICVRTKSCMYTIAGAELSLAFMSRCQLVITGRIDAICLERR